MKSVPSQKFGSESPSSPKLRAAASSVEAGRSADRMPSGSPISSATSGRGESELQGHGQTAGDLADDGLPGANGIAGVAVQERRRARPGTEGAAGWSRPKSARSSASCSGVSDRATCRAARRSRRPGTSRRNRNVRTETPSSVGPSATSRRRR